MKLAIKICKYILLAAMSVLLLLNIINILQMTLGKQEIPLTFGYGKAVVVTGSMEPAIMAGDLIVIHEQADYRDGDIVLFEANSHITHRIVETTQTGFITKGDANNVNDDEITKDQIVGKVVFTIPKIGYVAEFLATPFGMLVLVLGLLLIMELPRFIRFIFQRR